MDDKLYVSLSERKKHTLITPIGDSCIETKVSAGRSCSSPPTMALNLPSIVGTSGLSVTKDLIVVRGAKDCKRRHVNEKGGQRTLGSSVACM